MSEDQIRFNILFRRPKYPVIVISSDALNSAYDIDQLAAHCILSEPFDNEIIVKVIDSTGEEFWYSPEHFALSPGLAFKRWTKMQIIELYNNSLNEKENKNSYPIKSLSNKRLSHIISGYVSFYYNRITGGFSPPAPAPSAVGKTMAGLARNASPQRKVGNDNKLKWIFKIVNGIICHVNHG